MLPVLTLTQDGADHSLAATRDQLAQDFGLTDDERAQMLPSGRQATFANRVAWSTSYLRAGLLLEATGRGRFKITERGKAVLSQQPKRIDIPFLMQFPEFKAFREGSEKPAGGQSAATAPATADQTPEEAFESAFQSIRAAVEQDLLARVKAASPPFFEQLVVDLLVAMGYGGSQEDAGKAIGKSGDGGIDGVIKEDRLGLDTIYLQAKRWEGSVGRPVVQAFVGSLAGQHSARRDDHHLRLHRRGPELRQGDRATGHPGQRRGAGAAHVRVRGRGHARRLALRPEARRPRLLRGRVGQGQAGRSSALRRPHWLR